MKSIDKKLNKETSCFQHTCIYILALKKLILFAGDDTRTRRKKSKALWIFSFYTYDVKMLNLHRFNIHNSKSILHWINNLVIT